MSSGYDRQGPKTASHLSLVALVGILGAIGSLVSHEGTTQAFSGAIVVDGVGVVFGVICLVGAGIAIAFGESYLREHEQSQGEFIALALLSTVGMLILAMAGDLMTLFIAIEIMSLAVYVLAGFRRSSRRSQEAALKYFVYGAFASAFVLFGIALIYGEIGRITGTPAIGMADIGKQFANPGSVSLLGWVGVALVLAHHRCWLWQLLLLRQLFQRLLPSQLPVSAHQK